ncbi:MAG TPA: amidohydrolase [Methylomirabilota bacterium]|nr:amidohydrolase [Methylomirabilota bacterium]
MRRTHTSVLALSFVVAVLLTALPAFSTDEGTTPIKILYNAKVFTAEPADPYADAVAVRDDKILAVGNLTEVEKAVAGAKSERIDLHGKTLFPGFIDAHSHSIYGGINLISADASEKVRSMDDLVKFVAESKTSGVAQNGDIVEIYGMPLEFWSHTDELNAHFSAGAYKDQPLVLRGMDGHTAWANQAMLERAGINGTFLKSLSADQRSYYGVDKSGEPNGFVVDAGMAKVSKLIPPLSDARMLAAARAALKYNYSLGVTAWLDPLADEKVLKAYKQLADNHELLSEINAFPQVFAKDPAAELAAVQQTREAYKSIPNLHITGIKIFADGVVEIPSQTANLTKPYKNTGRNGELLFDPAKFSQLCVSADQQGLIIHVHALGDGAVKAALDGIAAARKSNAGSTLPHTLTHEQFVDPADFPRFRQLGVISALQLLWAEASADTIELVKPYIDPEIYKWQYPARSLLNSGAVIAGASDWPVSSANVFFGIYQAETRKGSEGVLDAAQDMPRLAMFYAYTRNSARAMNLSDKIGSIAPGKRADLILLDRDVLTVSPEDMRNTKVLWTIVAGKTVQGSPQ